ncbi:MAG: serine hydrolase domain-containing protein [Acidimicrobiales bacterium]
MARPAVILSAALLAVVLVGCGSDEPSTVTPDTTTSAPVVASSTVAPTTPTAPTTTTPPTTTSPDPAPSDFSAVSPIVADFVEQRGLNGAGLIVVHRDHGVLHHEHWGEFDEDRISLIASSSKMISAGVLLHLQDEGLLDIDAPVGDVAPWGAGNPDITPAQLVSNSSGLVGLGPDVLYGPYLCQFGPTFVLQECAEAIFTAAGDDADIIPPDSAFRYGGAQWQVAGAVAEAASGQTWAELIEEIYVEPCELDALAFNNPFLPLGSDGGGYPSAFDADPATLPDTDNPNIEGGAYVTTGDYGKLLLMQLRDGMCGDHQVLSAEAVDRMHDDRIGEVYDGNAGDPSMGYGMGWWVDRESGYISDGGAFGTVPWLDLEDGYGAYLVIEADSDTGGQLASQLFEVIDDAVNAG